MINNNIKLNQQVLVLFTQQGSKLSSYVKLFVYSTVNQI